MIEFSAPKPETAKEKSAPGPGAFGVIQSAALFCQNPTGMLLRDQAKYGDVVRYRAGSKVVHLISHPDHVEHVLLGNNRNYRKFSPHALLKQEMGEGLLLNDGDSWFKQRRLMQPAFHARHFETLSQSILQGTADMLKRWRVQFRDGEQIDIEAEMAKLVRLTIGQTLFSTDLHKEIEAVVNTNGGKFGLLLGNLPGTAQHRRFQRAVRQLDKVIYGVIRQRRQASQQEWPLDILSMMMSVQDKDTNEGMDDKQLRDELVTLLIAGYDTTSRTLTWAFYSLAGNPAAERRFHHELNRVLDDRAPAYPDLSGLSYTSLVVLETMRLLPPNSIIGRQAVADDKIGGYHISAGSIVALSQYLTHRHASCWDDSEVFEPERFSEDGSAGRHRFAYFPFGGGPRQCIGKGIAMMNIPLALAAIAQQYQLRLVPDHTVKFGIEVTLYPRGGLPMTLHSRQGK